MFSEGGGSGVAVGVVLTLGLSWLTILAGPIGLMLAILLLALVFPLWTRWRPWAILCIILNPLAVTAAVSAASYFRGTAALRFHGLGRISAFNLDRRTLLPKSSGGCMVDGSEWLRDDWHNLVLRSCVSVFGPMKGSPRSPYPSDEEMTGPWQNPEVIPAGDLRQGKVTIGGSPRELPSGSKLLDVYAPWAGIEDGYPETKVLGKDLGDGGFAIRIVIVTKVPPQNEVTTLFGGSPPKVMGSFAPDNASYGWGGVPALVPGE